MKKTDETFNGKPFFRKVFYLDETNSNLEKKIRLAQAAQAEITIVNILMKNPYPNIATYYQVNKFYVEMEELNTSTKKNQGEVIEIMKKTKDFLQSLGIMYIDWKYDNIGIANDGIYKLFDFDVSGLVDLNTNKWILEPLHYWSYNKAIENGCKTPKEIDDFAFNYGLIKK
jgi:serine/threonine protein kinase